MHVLLVALPEEGRARDFTTPSFILDDCVRYPPLGLLALVPELLGLSGIDVHVVDFAVRRGNASGAKKGNSTIDDCVRYIVDCAPDVIGVSVMTRLLWPMVELTRRVKEQLPGVIIVAGGPHIVHYARETLDLGTCDYVLQGWAEHSFSQLVAMLRDNGVDSESAGLCDIPGLLWKTKDGVVHSNNEPNVNDVLDSLPMPVRGLLDERNYYTAADDASPVMVYSSRGCPFHCTYCDVAEKRFHYRSAEHVVDEFESIVRSGKADIHVFDDTFNVSRERVIGICREIVRRGLSLRWSTRCRVAPFDDEMAQWLVKAGCRRIHVGVETLDENVLRSIRKGVTRSQIESFFDVCRRNGLDTLAYFMIGFPDETPQYRKQLFSEIRRLGPGYVMINVLYPLPKTDYYEGLLRSRVFQQDFWGEFARSPVRDFSPPIPRTPELQRELESLAESIAVRYCFTPAFLWRQLRECALQKSWSASARSFVHKFGFGVRVLRSRFPVSPSR